MGGAHDFIVWFRLGASGAGESNNFKNPRWEWPLQLLPVPFQFLGSFDRSFIYVAILVGSGFSVSLLNFGMELLWTFIALLIYPWLCFSIPIPPLDGSKILASFCRKDLWNNFTVIKAYLLLFYMYSLFTGALPVVR